MTQPPLAVYLPDYLSMRQLPELEASSSYSPYVHRAVTRTGLPMEVRSCREESNKTQTATLSLAIDYYDLGHRQNGRTRLNAILSLAPSHPLSWAQIAEWRVHAVGGDA